LDIEFDPQKDGANRAKHGLSLADGELMDLSTATVVPDDRANYRERRYRTFGRIEGEGYCLVFTYRGARIRVISFRRAHEREMARYVS
jgi:uncharacterized protein